MADNAFGKVKAAITSKAEEILAEFNVRNIRDGTRLKGDWTDGYLCPLCGDKSGSASFTHQLFLRCHQCGTKADVFEWLTKVTGKKAWDLCKMLAERLGVALPKVKGAARSQKAMPARMTEDVLAQAVQDLWDHKDAENARGVMFDRGFTDQTMLADLDVGWIRGWIVFGQRDERGQLMERYRAWNPTTVKGSKWMWYGMGTGGPGIWPGKPCPDGARILLLEGESDTMTAILRLRLHEQGWHVCTWTAGATSSPSPKDIPRSFQGKEVFIGYDNDVFQGDDYPSYYVEVKPGKTVDQARQGLDQRLKNLLNKLAPMFESLQCKVTILQCPVDPKKKFGGDFRDWVDGGGRDLADWKAFPFTELPTYGKVVQVLPFGEVFDNPHKPVRTRVQVEAIARDDVTLASTFKMECEMGQHPACSMCPGARLFPDGIIDMTEYQRELAVGLEQQQVNEKIIRDVVQKPRGCPRVEVVPIDVKNGSEWKAMVPGKVEDSAQRTLHVFSTDPPSLSGEMDVEGVCYPNARGNGLVMLATKVTQLDKTEVDLSPVLHDLLAECPAFSDDLGQIDEYLMSRARDYAFNVTKIYGRHEIQIAHDLLFHSVRRAELYGARQRAWLDICVYGDTRSGKSLTFRRMMEFHGMGISHTAVSNISRAGLLMGAGKDGMMKPGVMPRCNGKALLLDEFHFLVQNNLQEHPMSWMQSARDEGVASGVKIYGNRDLPAQVRLVTIANWMRNKRRVYEFECEHLGALYGAPETLARLDFGLAICTPPNQLHLDKADQFWNRERTRALMLRAWSQDAEQVVIDEDAAAMAKQFCKDWMDTYDAEQLPLFTPEEKCYSILRIAIALANICFSHPRGKIYDVHVRKVHVEWAANWLVQTWRGSGYDLYSTKRKEKQSVLKVFEAERMLTISLSLEDPTIAESKLNLLLTPFSASEVPTLTGQELQVANTWLARCMALHIFERVKMPNSYSVQYQLTAGGAILVGNLIRLAKSDEQQWIERHRSLFQWSQVTTKTGDPDLEPMNQQVLDYGNNDGQALPF